MNIMVYIQCSGVEFEG